VSATANRNEESGRGGRRVGRAVAVLMLSLSAIAVVATGAIFTDDESVSNDFTTGTVDISTSPTSAVVSSANMAPGDRSNGTLIVANDGSLELRYAIQRSATNTDVKGLRDSLRLRVGLQSGGSCDFPYFNTDGTTTTLTNDTQLYEGLGFPATATNTVGDATTGAQLNDRVLAAATNEVLCVSVVLPTTAGDALQDATTTATFDFVAEQTTNN